MSVYIPPVTSDELYHHGIKGMHWGVRHYQNKDGSLTSAGKKHYGLGIGAKKKADAASDSLYKARITAKHRQMGKEAAARSLVKSEAKYVSTKLTGGGFGQEYVTNNAVRYDLMNYSDAVDNDRKAQEELAKAKVAYNKAVNEYKKTPLGKIDKAVKKAKSFVNGLISRFGTRTIKISHHVSTGNGSKKKS